ncbi:hypothetical protein [Mesobacillus foraminis]|uniref:hypothetical protein n=1 Tax=Mesobacillus foraminis TaxID=279826 RepID=UPI000EF4F2CD|nr:hypothetical protein [Mesobacillus foraminis]
MPNPQEEIPPTTEVPPAPLDDLNWENAVRESAIILAELFGAYYGGPIGVEIAGRISRALFSGREQKDPFAQALADLEHSIRQIVDDALFREYKGRSIAIGADLKAYMHTKDKTTLNSIQERSNELARVLSEFDPMSMQVLAIAVYIANVNILTLRSLADYEPKYYQIAKERAELFAKTFEPKVNHYDSSLRESLVPLDGRCLVNLGSNFKTEFREVQGPYTKENKYGFVCEFDALYMDRTVESDYRRGTHFKEEVFFPFPYKGIRGPNDLSSHSVNMAMTSEERENTKAFKDCVASLQEKKSQRIAALDKVINPMRQSITEWQQIAKLHLN